MTEPSFLTEELWLRSLEMRPWPERMNGRYPFNLACLRPGEQIVFRSPVTFLVGENGSGKSTLLETLACAVNSITVGAESVSTDSSLQPIRELARWLRLVWRKRTRRGFFLRAEDFFGFARKMAQSRVEMEDGLAEVEETYRGRSQAAKDYARMPYQSELGAIRRHYGEGLDVRSHGESFLALFQARFVPGGLYLLDEPEAPLSPVRQLAFLALLKQMVDQESQFVIATHSPILMAFPGADILLFEADQIHRVAFDDLEHVRLTRDFLNNPSAYLRHLAS
jgi:predicted ATPase